MSIPARDLKVFLNAVQAAMQNPVMIDRMEQVCARNEVAIERFRQEQGELRIAREEHARYLAEARKKHDEQLARARDQWAAEEARRRVALEVDEAETLKLKERAERLLGKADVAMLGTAQQAEVAGAVLSTAASSLPPVERQRSAAA
jgi:hypothetical protein